MKYLLLIGLLAAFSAKGQYGSFRSLELPFGARNAALGGEVVSLSDGDIMQFVHNPATLDSVQITDLGVSISPFFADVLLFSGAYYANLGKLGPVAIGMSYLNYGEFDRTAANGDDLGKFAANDFFLVIGKSHRIANFSMGMNLKYARYGIDNFGASLLVADLGGLYRARNQDFSIGMVFRNFGFVLSDYAESTANTVPFDVLISTSIKPQYMPFRFSISAYQLASNQSHFEINDQLSQSNAVEIADRIFRKVNLGVEMIIHRNFQFLAGYSHLRRQELRIGESAYGSGFSYGIKIGIKKINIQYTHATYHAAGGTNFFTIQTNIRSYNKIL